MVWSDAVKLLKKRQSCSIECVSFGSMRPWKFRCAHIIYLLIYVFIALSPLFIGRHLRFGHCDRKL